MRFLATWITCTLIALTASAPARAGTITSLAEAEHFVTVGATGDAADLASLDITVFLLDLFEDGEGDFTTSASVTAGATPLLVSGDSASLSLGETVSAMVSSTAEGTGFAIAETLIDIEFDYFGAGAIEVELTYSGESTASVVGTVLPTSIGFAGAETELFDLDGFPLLDEFTFAEVPPFVDDSDIDVLPPTSISFTLLPGTFAVAGFDADSVASVNTIPEPSTLAIWSLLGLAGVGLGWRRKKKS